MIRARKQPQFVAFMVALGAIVILPAQAEQVVEGDEPPHAGLALIPMLDDLRSENPEERIAAAMTLRELGPSARLAIPELIKALADPLVGVRKSAAGALGGIGPSAASAVPALAASLDDPHRFVRSWAAMALYEIGPASRSATDALVKLMKTDASNLRSRSWAASALPKIDADPGVAVPALLKVIDSDDSHEVRAVAVLSIEHYGARAVELGAIEGLVSALRDPKPLVRANAACALSNVVDEASLGRSALALALRDEAPRVRGCAAIALSKFGVPALEWLDDLERLKTDDDAHVRHRAERAHAKLEILRESRR